MTAISLGTHQYTSPVIIKRKRPVPVVPVPFLGVTTQRTAAILTGSDRFGTVMQFDRSVTGQLVKTEYYDTGLVSNFWMDSNTQGNTALKCVLNPMVTDLTITGNADIRDYPWAYTDAWQPPDYNGPDYIHRADGLCLQGSGCVVERVRLTQIPGTALIIKGGTDVQGGVYGIFDSPVSKIRDVHVSHCVNGIQIDAGDSKISGICIDQCCKDGLILNSSGALYDGTMGHIQGADRAVVVTQQVSMVNCYHESARIGTYIDTGGLGTSINKLTFGPSTCTYRGLVINTNGVTGTDVGGGVKSQTEAYPDITGIEVMAGWVHTTLSGQIEIGAGTGGGNGSKGVIVRGHRGSFNFKGGWNVSGSGCSFISVKEAVTSTDITIKGNGDGGTALDLTNSNLNNVVGKGNLFQVFWDGTAAPVVYPGGGTSYNLAAGTELRVNGQLQS